MNFSVTSWCSAGATSRRLRLCRSEFRPRAARQLAAGADGAAHRLGDRVERHPEHVVQHERHPLTGLSLRSTSSSAVRTSSSRVTRSAGSSRRTASAGRFRADVAGALVAGARRTHLVEAEPAGDHGQPAADVVDLVDVGAGQPQKRLLRDVFGLADVAEHLVGEVDQIGAVAAPGLGDLVAR